MQTVPLELLINGLTVAAGAALTVERFTEVLKQIKERANRYFLERETGRAQQQVLQQARAQLDAIDLQRSQGVAAADAVLAATDALNAGAGAAAVPAADSETPDNYEQYSAVLHVPLTPVSTTTAAVNLFIRIAPMALGVILAGVFNLHFIALFTGQEVLAVRTLAEQQAWGSIALQTLDTFFTGILIGGGSQPVHVLLRFLTTRKLTDAERQALQQVADPGQEAVAVSAPAAAAENPLAWQDIRYEGGVNPQTLEQVHRRDADPERIVVHHTAMHSDLGFRAIVDEFLQHKQWLTGYHCIIMPDGSIRPFCRWDRCGNHARDHNASTLGIAFHGNFHQHDGDRYSNHDGRYGNTRPTEAQLQAGARVIALWRSLYPTLVTDIQQGVVPHRALKGAATACPGNQFPLTPLHNRVMAFEQAWQASAQAQQQLALFQEKPFIYAAG
ncbi:MAG: N-acetylmuramoyl-L-alanine amidase [Pseudomonadota bacterium]|nr:N-acetylmuramoyl-L-alanine amidase [Pseudomonadota bacterium]